MEKGYIENGFIVDLSHTQKISGVIYELSKVLDLPETKDKYICLKLGMTDFSVNELTSIKNLIELMDSHLSCISTSSSKTLESATELDIKVSEFTSELSAPTFEQNKPNPEVEHALNNLFGSDERSKETTENEIVKEICNADENSILENDLNNLDNLDNDAKELRNEPETLPTLYIRRTVRSGQSISSDGNIVIIGDVNPGAEIIAKGDITVWGILAGISHAGSEGNDYARIRALKLNPVQIRIGNIFARRPDTANIPYIQKTSEYTPEEAFTQNGSIVIRKIHQIN